MGISPLASISPLWTGALGDFNSPALPGFSCLGTPGDFRGKLEEEKKIYH